MPSVAARPSGGREVCGRQWRRGSTGAHRPSTGPKRCQANSAAQTGHQRRRLAPRPAAVAVAERSRPSQPAARVRRSRGVGQAERRVECTTDAATPSQRTGRGRLGVVGARRMIVAGEGEGEAERALRHILTCSASSSGLPVVGPRGRHTGARHRSVSNPSKESRPRDGSKWGRRATPGAYIMLQRGHLRLLNPSCPRSRNVCVLRRFCCACCAEHWSCGSGRSKAFSFTGCFFLGLGWAAREARSRRRP